MPEDRWGPERAQHDFDQRQKTDRRIQALEDRGHERPPRDGYSGNGIQRFLWIIVAGLVSLFLGGVVGGIVMYRQSGEHEKWIEGIQRQVDRLEQYVYRERK